MGSKIKSNTDSSGKAGYILLGLFLVLKPDTSVRAICYGCGVIAAGIRTSACAPVPER